MHVCIKLELIGNCLEKLALEVNLSKEAGQVSLDRLRDKLVMNISVFKKKFKLYFCNKLLSHRDGKIGF